MAAPAANIADPAIICRRVNPSILRFMVTPLRLGFNVKAEHLPDVGPQIVRAYLSRAHFEDVENSCPMVALPTDVARSGATARRAFETVFKAMVSVLERSLNANRPKARNRRILAQSIAALSIGGMIVA